MIRLKVFLLTKIIIVVTLFLLIPINNPSDEQLDTFNNYINNTVEYPKEAFLTFDDGPSVNNTRKILKILKDNNIKATFFIVGLKGEENPSILKELNDNGMAIGVHTYSHEYKKIFKNLETYMNDYELCKNSIKNITNKEAIPYIRIPGGTTNSNISKTNLNLIKSTLINKKIRYVDWNVCSGDADSHEVSVEKIKNNIKFQCQNKRIVVILMHDTFYKHFTVEALPEIISYLKKQGFVFKTFNELNEEEENEMKKMGIVNRK